MAEQNSNKEWKMNTETEDKSAAIGKNSHPQVEKLSLQRINHKLANGMEMWKVN